MVNFSLNTMVVRKGKASSKITVTAFLGIAIGFFIGISFPMLSSYNHIGSTMKEQIGDKVSENVPTQVKNPNNPSGIWVPSNPRGAERLQPGIVAAESDLYTRRLYGNPSEDLTIKPNYLVAFTVGYNLKRNIDTAVKKFSENFTILLFHYDGRTTEWDEFEWSKRAIHVSVLKQSKWWYAKRFLHPDIVASYDYIFLWDEDLGVGNFNAEEYINLVRKHGLDISQPGLDPSRGGTTIWPLLKRQAGREVHKKMVEKQDWCGDSLPPCAAFIDLMAPVFSREAWRCVWHLLPNDLVHGWGLMYTFHKCVEPAHDKMGVVDAQWVVHQDLASLGSQDGNARREAVRDRSIKEWAMFEARLSDAEKAYNKIIAVDQ